MAAAIGRGSAPRPGTSEILTDGLFNALIDSLERSAILLYVEPGRCPTVHRQRFNACLVNLGATGGVRYLRAIVDVGLATDNLIATVGHELQHAVEAAESISIPHGHRGGLTGTAAGWVGANVFETDDAEHVDPAETPTLPAK